MTPEELQAQNEAEMEEARRLVTFEKAERNHNTYNSSYSEKSRNKIFIDGIHRGWLSMDNGYGRPWKISALHREFVGNVRGKKDSDFVKRFVLRTFNAGNLPTPDEMDAFKAKRALEAQKRHEELAAAQAERRALEEAERQKERLRRERAGSYVRVLHHMLAHRSMDGAEADALAFAINELEKITQAR